MRCPQNESENTVWKRLRHGHRQAYCLMYTYTCVCLHKCAPYFLPYCWVTWNSWFWDEATARDRRRGRGRGSQGQAQFQELVIHIGKRISICLKPFALFVFFVFLSLSLSFSLCACPALFWRGTLPAAQPCSQGLWLWLGVVTGTQCNPRAKKRKRALHNHNLWKSTEFSNQIRHFQWKCVLFCSPTRTVRRDIDVSVGTAIGHEQRECMRAEMESRICQC